jgi:uroporphyrinogen-III decarboxylase
MLSSMSTRERLLAAIRGEDVDRLPWSPFLAYWWEAQLPTFQEMGQPWFFKEIGADTLLRGFGTPFQADYNNPSAGCTVTETHSGDLVRTEYHTRVGTLTATQCHSPVGNTLFLVEHPVKTREDFLILAYLVEHMRIWPDYQAVQEAIDALGEDGLLVSLTGLFGKTPFQSLVETWVGTEELIFALADYPETVEEALAVMSEKAFEAVRIAVDSPAEAFISWEDSSTQNISPKMFARYIAPDLTRWGQEFHAAGKLFLHHACGHLRGLLPHIAVEEIDMLESISPPPTGNIEIWDARSVLPDRIGVIGGIEPVRFLTLDLNALSLYVEELLDRVQRGPNRLRRYILANSDSCPPGVSVEKLKRVTEIARSWRI